MTTVIPPVRVEQAPETGAIPSQASQATLQSIEDNFTVVNKINPEDIQPDLEEWIPANIKKRVCKQFVYKKDKTADASGDHMCHCNYVRSKHTGKARDRENSSVKDWSVYKHTESVTTDAYGDLEFVGYGQKISKFVRIDHMSDENRILKLMLEHWKLQHPNLLISVTGGAKNFHMRPRLKEVFNRGLMKAASSTGAWIVTGGMHAGVMKHVGQAVQDYMTAHGQKASLNVIGITPWGCVNNKESLVDPDGSWPAQYRVEAPKQRRQSPIDRNHSHFIFVDNGTQLQYGTEIAFRAKLERAISLMKTDTSDSAVSVPVVCVVLEGGPGTLETVKSAIENGTPAVIVEGSGRAADILAFAYANSREEDVEVTDNLGKVHKKSMAFVDDDVWEEVARRINQEWVSNDPAQMAERISWVKDCLEHRDHMTIFRLDSSDTKDIDVAILRALLKVNKDQSLDQLKLALAWNRIDVAKSDIFTEEKKWDPGELNDVMYSALINDQMDFVELFMDNGCSLREFLTLKTMLQLYNNVPKNSVLYTLLQKERNKRDKYFSFEDIGSVIQNLMGDFYHPLYLRDDRYKHAKACEIMEETCDINDMDDVKNGNGGDDAKDVKKLEASKQLTLPGDTGVNTGSITPRMLMDTHTGELYNRPDFDEPARELFIWAILLNRVDMAMLFWTEGKEAIAAALLAQRLLKSLLTKTDDSELIKSLEDSLEHFENTAVGVLTQCYASDEKKARILLVRVMSNYGNTTIMQLAVKADNIQFIAHTACQALLTNIWRGKMARDVTWLQMGVCIFCPPLLFLLISYRKDDRLQLTEQKDARERKKKKPPSDSTEMEVVDEAGEKYGSKQKLVKKKKRQSVSTDDPTSLENKITPMQRIKYFYNAPVITFCHNCVSYLIFLGMYSIILLCNFHTKMSVYEYFLCFWVFTLFVEEVRQLFTDESASVFKKFGNYIDDTWNKMDALTIVTFFLGMILRNIPASSCKLCLHWARIILAINLMTFCFRMLHMFSVHKQLGPKLVMIGRMMVDLFYFVIVLVVFIVAYGLASQAILYPNTPFSASLFKKILKKPYFQMYGELFLEELEGENPCSNDPQLYLNGTIDRCPADTQVVPVLLGIYILITNVLMLNLLIAMFSNTFESVQKNADGVWKSIYYTMVLEYEDRPPLAAPVLIIAHIFLFFRWACHCTGIRRSAPSEHGFKTLLTEAETKQLVLWENLNVDEYMRQSASQEAESMENQVKETNDRVDQLSHRLEEMAESSFMLQSASSGPTSSQGAKLPAALDERISYLEDQMKRTSRALDWIIQSMVEKGTGSQSGPPQLTDIDQMREEAAARRQKQAASEKEQYKELFRKQLDLHIKARSSYYPCTYQAVLRFNVPNAKVTWDEKWSDYEPVKHTDRSVLEGPDWADPVDLLAFDDHDRPNEYKFNAVDDKYGLERTSYCGPYQVVNNIPLNPKGRTGLIGRGLLGRWGPNHASDPIVTRWCKNERGEVVRENGKRVLEFVAIFRQDSKQWAIPGGMLRHGLPVHACLKIEFSQEALGTIVKDESSKSEVRARLDELFSQGEEVYRGYADDHRNTDNAWLETIAVNYHDEEGTITTPFELKAGENVEMVRWMKILSRQSLYGGHLAILQSLARKRDAAF